MAPKTINFLLIYFVVASTILGSCYYDAENDLYGVTNCDSVKGTYAAEVKPLMDQYCSSCHNNTNQSGGIIVDNHASISANSTKVLASLNHDAGTSQMPKGSPKLSDCDIKKVSLWISAGKPNN